MLDKIQIVGSRASPFLCLNLAFATAASNSIISFLIFFIFTMDFSSKMANSYHRDCVWCASDTRSLRLGMVSSNRLVYQALFVRIDCLWLVSDCLLVVCFKAHLGLDAALLVAVY